MSISRFHSRLVSTHYFAFLCCCAAKSLQENFSYALDSDSRSYAVTGFTTVFTGVSARADKNFEAPGSISLGQTATLKWYFTGSKLTVSGGQFPPGTVITGKQMLKVSPKKTTTYVFDLYYHPGVAAENEKTATGKIVHAQYKVTVEVVSGAQTGLLSFKGSRGWRVGYQTGWTAMPNREGSDDMMFFQQEEDAVERLAVTVVPVKNKTVQQLMDDVRADIPFQLHPL